MTVGNALLNLEFIAIVYGYVLIKHSNQEHNLKNKPT
jgi:hypothetical protein